MEYYSRCSSTNLKVGSAYVSVSLPYVCVMFLTPLCVNCQWVLQDVPDGMASQVAILPSDVSLTVLRISHKTSAESGFEAQEDPPDFESLAYGMSFTFVLHGTSYSCAGPKARRYDLPARDVALKVRDILLTRP